MGVTGELFPDRSREELADPSRAIGRVLEHDACSVDQFELQLRTLCGLPLEQPRLLSPVAMINLLGDLWSRGTPRWQEALRRPGVRLHLYGKTEPRPGRKMGHLNCLAADPDRALALALEVRDALLP